MNRDGLVVLFLMLSFMMCSFGVIIVHTVQHENTHQQIFGQHGINSTVEIGIFGGKTIPIIEDINLSDTSAVMRRNRIWDETRKYNMLNEIVGYNILTLSFSIMVGLLMVSFVILMRDGP